MDDDKRIELLKEQLNLPLIDMDRIERMNLLRILLFNKKTKIKDKNDIEKCKEEDIISKKIIQLGSEIINNETFENQKRLYEIIKENYQFRGRRYFKDFLIAIEWNFDNDMKFYNIRKTVFNEWIEYLQLLEYGELRGLSISAPPRTRKNWYRYRLFYVVYVKASR